MIFNTMYGVSSPTYPSGDRVKYPVQDIPEGSLRVYTEQDVSDVGSGIERVLDNQLTYTVSEMGTALQSVGVDIDNISNAIYEAMGIPIGSRIPLEQMPDMIRALPKGLQGRRIQIITQTYTVI